jgi:hypothetical protein
MAQANGRFFFVFAAFAARRRVAGRRQTDRT